MLFDIISLAKEKVTSGDMSDVLEEPTTTTVCSSLLGLTRSRALQIEETPLQSPLSKYPRSPQSQSPWRPSRNGGPGFQSNFLAARSLKESEDQQVGLKSWTDDFRSSNV